MSSSPQNHIHPSLRAIAANAAAKPGMAEVSPEEARAGMAARTAAREPGPHIDKVVDFIVPGLDAGIPVRIYHPKDATGVTMAFHGGGWLMGNRDSFDAVCRHLANDSGLAVVSV